MTAACCSGWPGPELKFINLRHPPPRFLIENRARAHGGGGGGDASCGNERPGANSERALLLMLNWIPGPLSVRVN